MKQVIKSFLPHKLNLFLFKLKKEIKNVIEDKKKKVECPLCKSKFEKFDSFGLVERENARCSKCGSLERHRLLWKYVNDKHFFKNIKSGFRVLHFAPEALFYNYFDSHNKIEYIPCDLFPENYTFNGNSKVVKVDITNIPFEDNYFDFIICNHVLEHIPDDTLAMNELLRVMKVGGNGVFQVPIDYERETTYEDFSITTPEEREKAFGQYDHVRWYGRDYKERLASVGFKVNEDAYVKRFSKRALFKYGLMYKELIYHCSKQ